LAACPGGPEPAVILARVLDTTLNATATAFIDEFPGRNPKMITRRPVTDHGAIPGQDQQSPR
jgi:hypothetical protein